MNNIKKVLSAWMLVACVLPVAAQYPAVSYTHLTLPTKLEV